MNEPSQPRTDPLSVEGGAEPMPAAEMPTLAPPSEGPAATAATAAVPGYEIECELGRGGMGVVYKARQVAAGRVVALKMILSGGHAGPADLARFRREAQAVARLQHPGIVQVFEVGEHDGRPFFSLELVGGGSLDKRLKGGPLRPRAAALLVERLARAMHAAHEQGVVHRDLKPANVLLTADGKPKVTDFGLAKTLDVEQGQTATGALMGTPPYMAPEQAGGRRQEIGPATDVYALGAVLYECLTGRPPFQAATPLDTILQVISDEPVPPRRLQPKAPRDLETVCLKCLRKEPQKRYGSAAELAEDLRSWREGEPIKARPAGLTERALKWAKRRPALASLLLVVLLAALGLSGGGVWFTLRLDRERRRAEDNATAEGKARQEADAARRDALKQLDRAETSLYVNGLGRADRETELHDLLRSNVFLDECRRDYRNWEWRHLRARNHYTVPLHTFPGNGSLVSNVVFSPDGSRLAGVRAGALPPGRRGFDELDNKPDEVKVWDARTGAELLSLRGHTRTIWAVAISPDGGLLASASDDKTVRVWDAHTGAPLLPPTQHGGPVWSVAFSPDGGRLVSVSGPRRGADNKPAEVKVWGARTGAELFAIKDHVTSRSRVAFSPDGGRLAVACDDKTVGVWDARTGAKVRTLPGGAGEVSGVVAFSPDGERLAATNFSRLGALNLPGEVKVWDARTGAELLALKGPGGPAADLAFSPDSSRLTCAGWDGTLRVWDARGGGEVLSIKNGPAVGGVFSPDGGRLAGAGQRDLTGDVCVWDARTGEELLSLKGHNGPVRGLAFSPDGSRLASDGMDGAVKVWDVRAGAEGLALRGHALPAGCVAFSPDGQRLASGGGLRGIGAVLDKPGEVKVWDARTGAEVLSLRGHAGSVQSVAFSPDGSYLASGGGALNSPRPPPAPRAPGRPAPAVVPRLPVGGGAPGKPGEVKLWDARTGIEIRSFQGHTNAVTGVAFSPDGGRLASASYDKTVKVWDVRTGGQLLSFDKHNGPVISVAFSLDGNRLASVGGGDGALMVWDAGTGAVVCSCKGQTGPTGCVAFSPDGQRLAGASNGRAVKVWDARRGAEVLSLEGHTNLVYGVAFSPDGSRLISAGVDKTVRVWDARGGAELLALKGHANTVSGVAFSPDGRRLASAGYDHIVRVWDTTTRPEALVLRGHTNAISSVAFSADGSRVIAQARAFVGQYGAVRAWDSATGKPILPCTDPPPTRARELTATYPARQLLAWAEGETVFVRSTKDDAPAARARRQQDDDWTTIAWRLQQTDRAREAPDDFAARFHLAHALAGLREQVHVRLTAGDAPGCRHAVTVLAAVAGRDAEAVRLFQEVLARRPSRGLTADELLLALAYHKRGQDDEARRWLGRAVVSSERAGLRPAVALLAGAGPLAALPALSRVQAETRQGRLDLRPLRDAVTEALAPTKR
jgi:WD40 repeat protein